MTKQDTQAVCKSVFKSGESTAIKEQFTRKWIELINQFERNGQTVTAKQ